MFNGYVYALEYLKTEVSVCQMDPLFHAKIRKVWIVSSLLFGTQKASLQAYVLVVLAKKVGRYLCEQTRQIAIVFVRRSMGGKRA